MQVRELMNQSVVSITPGESASLAARLLARHQLAGKSVQASKLETPLDLTQVFPNLFEGKRGVDVKI